MLDYILGNGRSIQIFELHEALTRACVNETDNDFCKDQALADCFEGKKVKHLVYDLKTYSAELEIAVSEGVEILIIHREQNE
jgi:hypothetical protein